jgi:hypothetical protein
MVSSIALLLSANDGAAVEGGLSSILRSIPTKLGRFEALGIVEPF